jgi:hypothetical protein
VQRRCKIRVDQMTAGTKPLSDLMEEVASRLLTSKGPLDGDRSLPEIGCGAGFEPAIRRLPWRLPDSKVTSPGSVSAATVHEGRMVRFKSIMASKPRVCPAQNAVAINAPMSNRGAIQSHSVCAH